MVHANSIIALLKGLANYNHNPKLNPKTNPKLTPNTEMCVLLLDTKPVLFCTRAYILASVAAVSL